MIDDRQPGAHDLAPAGHPPGETTGTDERAPQHMATAVLTFDLVGELARLHAEQAWQRGERNAKTLVKDADLRVVLIALRAGGRMEEHHAPGRITIQTLVGRLALRVGEQSVGLRQEWDDRSGRRGDGRREGGLACGQLAANSTMMVAQRSWNTRRRSPGEMASPDRATARKYWRCSSKLMQKRAADAKAPNPRMG